MAHSVIFNGAVYCRRHGGTARAVAYPSGHPENLPDLEDRTPSLVNWIADDLDQPIRHLLAGAALAREKVITDGNVQLARDIVRRSRWERSWRIVDHTGLVLKVCIYAEGGGNSLIRVRVADDDVFEGVPPWISQRQHGEVSLTIDAAQRRGFYQSIQAAIGQGLQNRCAFRREL